MESNFLEEQSRPMGNISTKIIAGLAIVICLLIGVIGLIVPIIPGLLFLAIAAVIVADQSSSMNRWLRKNETMRKYLDHAEGLVDLDFSGKAKYCGLLCVKLFIDSMVFIISAMTALLNFSVKKYRQYR